MKYDLGSLEGRQNRMRGLVEAAKKIAAQEQAKKTQLKLFETLKSEDAKKIR
jgi:hypothetical protein